MNTKGVEDGISDEQVVRQVYPDAEVHASDEYFFWIGRKKLSDAFEQSWDELDKVDAMPCETEEEVRAGIAARKAVEKEAEDRAWADARAKLPATQPAAVPEAPTFAYQLAMALTRNGADAPHMQAEINMFLYENGWKMMQEAKSR